MNSRLNTVLAAIFITVSLTSIGVFIGINYAEFKGDKIQNIANLITINYYGKIDKDFFSENLIKGLNDEYSYYLNSEKYQKEKKENSETAKLSLKQLPHNITYLKISGFQEKTIDEFNHLFDGIKPENLDKLIIDLRNNLGGNIETALYIERHFINNGTLLKEVYNNQKEKISQAMPIAKYKNTQIIILVNHETSSVAEQMAAAFKDNKRAKVIGEKTFGKGTIGNYFELKDGSAIHLTIGRWFRQNGESIDKIGVQPDIEIPDKNEVENDEILNLAIMLFK